jgi:hypothetical protein
MKNTKRIVSMVMVVVLMLALSISAFATDTVTLYVNGISQGAFNIGSDSTVYDIVAQMSTAVWSSESNAIAAYSPLYDSTNPLYNKYSQKVCYLSSLNGSGSAPHTPVTGSIDGNGNYISTQTVDTVLQQANTKLANYGGLKHWGGNGYGYSADGTHAVYVGWDWVFTVNGNTPGKTITPASPIYGDFFQYTMRESLLASGDEIDLDYDYYFFVFSLV